MIKCHDCHERLSESTKGKRMLLYDQEEFLTNWPGSLMIPVLSRRVGQHNIAKSQHWIYFRFAGKDWLGRRYGENTAVVHCRVLKKRRPLLVPLSREED